MPLDAKPPGGLKEERLRHLPALLPASGTRALRSSPLLLAAVALVVALACGGGDEHASEPAA